MRKSLPPKPRKSQPAPRAPRRPRAQAKRPPGHRGLSPSVYAQIVGAIRELVSAAPSQPAESR